MTEEARVHKGERQGEYECKDECRQINAKSEKTDRLMQYDRVRLAQHGDRRPGCIRESEGETGRVRARVRESEGGGAQAANGGREGASTDHATLTLSLPLPPLSHSPGASPFVPCSPCRRNALQSKASQHTTRNTAKNSEKYQ